MKDFLIYTGLRIALFVACYAICVGVWMLISQGSTINFVGPFIAAVVISSVLSFRVLKEPRARFARRVEERANKANAAFEGIRSREDR